MVRSSLKKRTVTPMFQSNTIVVSNGTLTNDGGGVVTITTGGIGLETVGS